MKKSHLFALCLSALLLIGCSETPKLVAKKEPEKPAEPISGESALFKMYQVARSSLASDVQVLKLNSIYLTDVPAEPGKAGAWQATFTSASQGKARTYTYSVEEQEGNLHKGVFSLGDESWSGQQGASTAFDIRAASIDSTAAYQTAAAKSDGYSEKHPGTVISFLLEKTNRFPNPAWRVIWGESVGTASFSVYVDASVGTFLEKMH